MQLHCKEPNMKTIWISSSKLSWISHETLEQSLWAQRDAASKRGYYLGLTLDPIHYTIRDNLIFPKGSFKLLALPDKVRVLYPNGSTQIVKNRIASYADTSQANSTNTL